MYVDAVSVSKTEIQAGRQVKSVSKVKKPMRHNKSTVRTKSSNVSKLLVAVAGMIR